MSIDYLTYVQLRLNLPRLRRQQAADVWLGVSMAQSVERADQGWADALAEEQGQVEELDFQINAARSDARRMRERAQRGEGW